MSNVNYTVTDQTTEVCETIVQMLKEANIRKFWFTRDRNSKKRGFALTVEMLEDPTEYKIKDKEDSI